MAANTDKFKRLARKWVGSIGAGGVADETVTTIPLSSSSGLPTDTAVVATIDRVDANGIATPSLEESVVGVVSGNNLVTCTRGVEGTAQAHSAGAVVEILFTNKVWGDLIDGILAEHSQSGAHTTDTINEKTKDAGVTVDGVKHKDGQVYTDQINEKTEDAGVTVDGLKIKDGEPVVADAKDIKFASGAKIERDAGHLKLTPETDKFVEIAVRRQGGDSNSWITEGTTNYSETGVIIQCGSRNIAAANTLYQVTFPTAFSQAPIVVASADSGSLTYLTTRDVSATSFYFQSSGTGKALWIAIGRK